MFIAEEVTSLTFSTLKLTIQDQALVVTIHRPDALNALSVTVIDELRQLFTLLRKRVGTSAADTATADWSVRGVVLTGTGEKSFIAGADITQMQHMTQQQAAEYATAAQELTTWFAELPVPVIAAVNGYALGGGCELAMACDYIIASENAVFGQPEVGLGLIPGFGGTVRLFRYVGPGMAREMIYSGKKITAMQAQDYGLVNQVCATPAATVAAAIESIALTARQSPHAVAQAKRVMQEVEMLDVKAGLAFECAAFAETFETPDMQEGTSAFVAKRKPQFIK